MSSNRNPSGFSVCLVGMEVQQRPVDPSQILHTLALLHCKHYYTGHLQFVQKNAKLHDFTIALAAIFQSLHTLRNYTIAHNTV